jgi:TatD DNase family protein
MDTTFRLIDTHAHLHLAAFDDDRAEVLRRAADAGVARIIEIGYDLPSSRAAIALAEQHPQIYAVVGVQPNHAHEAPADWRDQVAELARHPRVLAIGEIGLDYYWKDVPPALQDQFFRSQLALADELGLPVVIHSRDAQADTVAVLRDHYGSAYRNSPRGIMHSFSGTWDYAAACLELGFLLSFSGPLTFKRSQELREVAARLPADRLLVETDSPYLSPHPHRGRRNEPAHVRLVAEQIAVVRECNLAELASQLWSNATSLLALD